MADLIDLELTAMAHGGSALGRVGKRVVFVPYAIPGERVRAEIANDRGSYAHARLLDIVESSSERVTPVCPYFGQGGCGGCHWQHIDYPAQLRYKQAVVADQLKRLGKFPEPPVKPTVPSPSPWNYRVHATLTFTPDGLPAFYGDNNQSLVPIEVCYILHSALVELLGVLDFGAEGIERVRLQVGSDPADRMIVLHAARDVAPAVRVKLPVSVNLLLPDNEPANLIGKSYVTYHLLDRAFRVTAGGFFQANLPVAEMLVDQVIKRLDLQGSESILDLYSGVGLFTRFIAERAGYVLSAESYPPVVTDADENLADLDNVELVEGSVEDVLDDLDGPVDGVVVDPPRTGLAPQVIKNLVRLGPERIVYVSCDPATFARDAKQFADSGYRLLDVLPVDMFPQTFHIELVATLKK